MGHDAHFGESLSLQERALKEELRSCLRLRAGEVVQDPAMLQDVGAEEPEADRLNDLRATLIHIRKTLEMFESP